jgi:hypothetical protein
LRAGATLSILDLNGGKTGADIDTRFSLPGPFTPKPATAMGYASGY